MVELLSLWSRSDLERPLQTFLPSCTLSASLRDCPQHGSAYPQSERYNSSVSSSAKNHTPLVILVQPQNRKHQLLNYTKADKTPLASIHTSQATTQSRETKGSKGHNNNEKKTPKCLLGEGGAHLDLCVLYAYSNNSLAAVWRKATGLNEDMPSPEELVGTGTDPCDGDPSCICSPFFCMPRG